MTVTHMVIFRRPEGKPGYHQAESVEDALRFVERLRNQENVTDTRIFRMEEVPIEVRTVYKVELAASAPEKPATPAPLPAPIQPSVASELANSDAAELAPQDVFEPPVPVAAAKGRRFNRS